MKSADPLFDFQTLLRKAVEHEHDTNQTTPSNSDEANSYGPTPPLSDTDVNLILETIPLSTKTQNHVSSKDTSDPFTSKLSSTHRHAAEGKKNARKRKRQAKKNVDAVKYQVPRYAGKRYTNEGEVIPTDLCMDDLPAASTAYVGKLEDHEDPKMHVCMDDMLNDGFRVIEHKSM